MQRFIISAGRCGSTWLARLVNENKKACVISDLIEPMGHNLLFSNTECITGQEFDLLLNQNSHDERSWYWCKHSTPERLYSPKDKTAFSLFESYTLPFLGLNVNSSQILIRSELRKRKKALCRDHLEWLFEFIAKELCHKEYWIERTGGSLSEISKVVKAYPSAKYIILTRDINNTALSMSKYPFFRLYTNLRRGRYFENYNQFFTDLDIDLYRQDLKSDMINALEVLSSSSCAFKMIDYESLVNEPQKILSETYNFLETPFEFDDIKRAVQKFPPKKSKK